MPTLRLFHTLLGFPLFKGMGHEELERLAGRTKFDFLKLAAGTEAARRGDAGGRLLMLAGGRLQAATASADGAYTISEDIAAPYIMEPERLFGLHQERMTTFTALTDAHLIAIDKVEVARLCDEFMAFRLNLLNLLATEAQRAAAQPWLTPPADLRRRIARFVAARCLTAHGRKVVSILMERLAAEVNDSRLNVSHALRAMRDAGLIEQGRGLIAVPALERLREALA